VSRRYIGSSSRSDRLGYIHSAIDADKKYIYLMGFATATSACYAYFYFLKFNIPFVLFYIFLKLISRAILTGITCYSYR